MLASLLAERGHRFVVQRYADRLAAFGFVGMNPCGTAFEIDIGPTHAPCRHGR
jgi:hypothetical protein